MSSSSTEPFAPSEPAAAIADVGGRARRLWVSALLMSLVVVAVAVTVSTVAMERAAMWFSSEMDVLREDFSAGTAEVRGLRAEVEALREGVEIMTPPNNDKLFTILSKGVGVSEDILRTTTATNVAPSAAFLTDLVTTPFDQRTDAFTQEIFIQNTHATLNLCYKPILWSSAGATCELKCAGVVASFTCSAAATDGLRLAPGQGVQRRFDGTACICVVGSGVGVNYQSERVIR